METLVPLAIVLVFPVIAAALLLRQIRSRAPQDDTFLENRNDWGAQ